MSAEVAPLEPALLTEHDPRRCNVGPWRFGVVGSELPQRAKYTALAMSVFMDWQGETIISLKGLVDCTGQSKHTVKKYVDLLEASGWLLRRPGGPGRRSTSYAATPAALPPSGAVWEHHYPVQSEDTTPYPQVVHSEGEVVHFGGSSGAPWVPTNSRNSIELHAGAREQQPECFHDYAPGGPEGKFLVCQLCGVSPASASTFGVVSK